MTLHFCSSDGSSSRSVYRSPCSQDISGYPGQRKCPAWYLQLLLALCKGGGEGGGRSGVASYIAFSMLLSAYLIHDDVRFLSMQNAGEGHHLLAPWHLLHQLVGPIPAVWRPPVTLTSPCPQTHSHLRGPQAGCWPRPVSTTGHSPDDVEIIRL